MQWREACNRGQFDIDVLTRRRAEDEGISQHLHPEGSYIGCVQPFDGLPAYWVNFDSFVRLANFCVEMEPRVLNCFAVGDAPDEDADQLFEAIQEFRRSRARSAH